MSNHRVTILNAADGIDSIAEPINQWIDLSNGVMQRRFGHDDYDETAEVLTAALSQQEQANKWLALVTDADGRVVGGSFARRSKYENPTILDELEIIVEESARGRGVGAAVQAGLEQLAAEQGCRTLRGWATHPISNTGDDPAGVLMPKEGVRLPRNCVPSLVLACVYSDFECVECVATSLVTSVRCQNVATLPPCGGG